MKSTRRQLERPGSPDAHPEQLVIGSALLEHAADRVAHVAHHGRRPVADASGHVHRSQPLPLRVKGGDAQIGSAQVDADGETAFVRAWYWC